MWFNQQILGTINIPFDFPKQILGHDTYTCHVCNLNFEGPNLLKLHLALKCSHFVMSQFWCNFVKGIEILRSQMSSQISPPSGNEMPSIPYESSKTYSVFKPYSEQHIVPITVIKKKKAPIWNSYEGTEGAVSSAIAPMANLSSVNMKSQSTSTSEMMPIHPNSAFSPYERPYPVETTYRCENSIRNPFEGVPLGPPSQQKQFIPPRPCTPPRPSPAPRRAMTFRLPVLPFDSNNAVEIEKVYSNCRKMGEKFTCQFCGNSFSRKYGLRIHIRTHTGYKPLKCPICPKMFGDPSNMNKHIRLHSGPNTETPYRCKICGKFLVRRRDLTRHMQSVHKEHNSDHSSDKSSEA